MEKCEKVDISSIFEHIQQGLQEKGLEMTSYNVYDDSGILSICEYKGENFIIKGKIDKNSEKIDIENLDWDIACAKGDKERIYKMLNEIFLNYNK